MAELFGFTITRTDKEDKGASFTLPTSDDGAEDIAQGGFYSSTYDIEGKDRTQYDLIRRYRNIAQQPECESAIEDIISEAVASNEFDAPISLALDGLNQSDKVKKRIREEFDRILQLLSFTEKVEVLERYSEKVNSINLSIFLPSIIRLKDYVRLNQKKIPLSRKNILKRDGHICQYCNNKSNVMTIDHIIPKHKGGKDSWDNLVAACVPCNTKKGNKFLKDTVITQELIEKLVSGIDFSQATDQDSQVLEEAILTLLRLFTIELKE